MLAPAWDITSLYKRAIRLVQQIPSIPTCYLRTCRHETYLWKVLFGTVALGSLVLLPERLRLIDELPLLVVPWAWLSQLLTPQAVGLPFITLFANEKPSNGKWRGLVCPHLDPSFPASIACPFGGPFVRHAWVGSAPKRASKQSARWSWRWDEVGALAADPPSSVAPREDARIGVLLTRFPVEIMALSQAQEEEKRKHTDVCSQLSIRDAATAEQTISARVDVAFRTNTSDDMRLIRQRRTSSG